MYRDNPPMAAWGTMERHRNKLPKDVGVQLELGYGFGKGGNLHRIAGTKSPPQPWRGAQIVLSPPFRYRTLGNPRKGTKPKTISISILPLFTRTAKMTCYSFSLPAGPIPSGGTCPLSRAQNTAPLARRDDAVAEQFDSMPPGGGDPVYICDGCYAGKGNYVKYPLTAIRQSIRLAWTQAALRAGTFASEMIRAIDQLLELPEKTQRTKKVNTKYFRIHDAGDLWSPAYYLAWREVCEYYQYLRRGREKVVFWCPTRMWASPAWQALFAEYPPPANLTLRPSALFFGAPAPNLDHLDIANGSTASSVPLGTGIGQRPGSRLSRVSAGQVWDCPAYDANEGDDKSCASVRCRVCWPRPDVAGSYREH